MIISGNTITVNGVSVDGADVITVGNDVSNLTTLSNNIADLNAVDAAKGFYTNPTTISASYTIASGSNAMTAGPINIADGAIVTISDGSMWTVL